MFPAIKANAAFSETDISLVRASILFQGLPQAALFEAGIRAPENQLRLPPGAVFLNAGARAPGLHVVAHGTIELVAQTAEGSEKIVEFSRTGGLLAEETLFNGEALRYSARTITAAAVLRIPEEMLTDWLTVSPAFRQRLMGLLAERTDYIEKDLVTYCTKNATARLVCYLVCNFNRAPCTPDGTLSLTVSLPRNKLASRLGVSDSHLSRAFKELEGAELIVCSRNGIFIPNVQALSRYVCPAGCDW